MAKMMKKGGSFDLNKDGKTTFKDVLIGRGVLPKTAKKGTKVKKAQNGANAKKSFDKSKNPKLGFITSTGIQTEEWDTSGYAGGKRKMFPMKLSTKGKEPEYRTYPRKIVENQIKHSKDDSRPFNNSSYQTGKQSSDKYNAERSVKKNKVGGRTPKSMMKTGGKMTKKCKYGCK
jgi:hypothetical protein